LIYEYHPANEIRGSYYDIYQGKTIVVGLTSSVAVYRCIDIIRELIRRSADVIAVMSKEATKLVTPTLLEWATGNKVYTEFGGEVGHISLSRKASSMLICPATANTISKISSGIGDTSVTLLALSMLGLGKPVIIVPAMHYNLWKSPPLEKSINELKGYGVTVIPPRIEENRAKIAPIDDVLAAVEAQTLRGNDLKGLKILVTAGPTREFLDPIRFLTNASSGKMGVAIAREAYFRGAEVTLIHGPLTTSKPYYIRTKEVTTAEEMLNVVREELTKDSYDALIMAAAPTDFRFRESFKEKVSSERELGPLYLELNPKISLEIRRFFKGLMVGFSAEYVKGDKERLRLLAINKLKNRGFDIIVANDVSRKDIGFASDFNEVLIITKNEVLEIPKAPKTVIARIILDKVKVMIKK